MNPLASTGEEMKRKLELAFHSNWSRWCWEELEHLVAVFLVDCWKQNLHKLDFCKSCLVAPYYLVFNKILLHKSPKNQIYIVLTNTHKHTYTRAHTLKVMHVFSTSLVPFSHFSSCFFRFLLPFSSPPPIRSEGI